MRSSKEHVLKALLFINLWLQAFDGAATYMGVTIGYGEGNPLVASTFGHIGVGPRSVSRRPSRAPGCSSSGTTAAAAPSPARRWPGRRSPTCSRRSLRGASRSRGLFSTEARLSLAARPVQSAKPRRGPLPGSLARYARRSRYQRCVTYFASSHRCRGASGRTCPDDPRSPTRRTRSARVRPSCRREEVRAAGGRHPDRVGRARVAAGRERGERADRSPTAATTALAGV
jgi:hypothetical protein